MSFVQWKINSKIGPVYLVASDKGLQSVFLKKQNVPMAKTLKGSSEEIKILSQASRELQEYFSGERKNFNVPMDVQGTSFQKRVWDQLKKIPYGKTCSYKDVAVQIKSAKAFRAVGTANGKNPLCIIVPCHRVIAADGSLGGYSGGLGIKRKLLNLERSKNFSD